MSDIRFNQWLHNSGTGGVSQVDGGHVGIGTTNPLIPVGSGNTAILNVGVVTANSFYGDGSNLSGVQVGGASSLSFNDNIGAYWGNSQDLKIYHDGNHSYIDDQGTGNLKLRSGTLEISNLAGNKTSAIFSSGGGQTLNFNNSTKFVTTNTGAVVTGILTATNFITGVSNLHNLGLTLSSGQLDIGSNIKAGSAGVVTATSFAPTAVTAQLSHRNILHNGEFKVIQRYGTSFTINSSSDNQFTFDRWAAHTHDNLGDFTVSQEADAPAGFRTSAKIQCTGTLTSTSGTVQSMFQQTVEAQNVSHIFNGSGSQPMTLSFYYKSNTTDQRLIWFYTPDTTRHYAALFTPSATNTWERFTIPIPADTSNTVNDDTDGGFYVRFMIDVGDTYIGGRPTSWSALSNDRYNGHTNLCTNTANNFYITGVQLEMGSVATPYEHRTMSEELVNCQRYYYPYKSILKGSSDGVGRPWIPVQMFLNSSSDNDVFVVIAGLNEQRAKMRTGSATVTVLAPLNSAPQTTYPSAGQWAYFYRGQGSGFKSGGGAFTWNDGYYNMYGCRSIAQPRPTQIMIETNSEVGKVYVELDDEI